MSAQTRGHLFEALWRDFGQPATETVIKALPDGTPKEWRAALERLVTDGSPTVIKPPAVAVPPRRLFRGVPQDVAPFKIHERGPLGRGVYLSGQPSVASKYGTQVIEADASGNIFNGVKGYLDPEVARGITTHLTPEEMARYQRWNAPKYNADFVDMISRSAEHDRIPQVFGKAGYSGIEALVDGHEAAIFDPANLKYIGPWGSGYAVGGRVVDIRRRR